VFWNWRSEVSPIFRMRTRTANGHWNSSGDCWSCPAELISNNRSVRSVAEEYAICHVSFGFCVQLNKNENPKTVYRTHNRGFIHSRMEYSDIILNEQLICVMACQLEIWEHLSNSVQFTASWNFLRICVKLKWLAQSGWMPFWEQIPLYPYAIQRQGQ
jgi:hypothetical protein